MASKKNVQPQKYEVLNIDGTKYRTNLIRKYNERTPWKPDDPKMVLAPIPGTVVKFAVQDDQQDGWETPADGYNALDPTRLISYGKTHSSLMVEGKLTAAGTLNNKVLFTSAAENPKIADWEAIYPQDDRSLIEYSIIADVVTGFGVMLNFSEIVNSSISVITCTVSNTGILFLAVMVNSTVPGV